MAGRRKSKKIRFPMIANNHSVTRTQIDHAQFRNGFADGMERTVQKIGYFFRRIAAKSIVKELLIQAGPLVDLIVIVESQTLRLAVFDEGEENFVLA